VTFSTTPLARLSAWLLDWPQLSVCLMAALVVLSALGVVYSAHRSRAAYAEIQELERQQDALDSEYEKLLLEQSAWAGYSRIDQVAREDLGMSSPAPDKIVVVRR